MKQFDTLPKSLKKTLRYISQEINSIEKIEHIEKVIRLTIEKRKQELR